MSNFDQREQKVKTQHNVVYNLLSESKEGKIPCALCGTYVPYGLLICKGCGASIFYKGLPETKSKIFAACTSATLILELIILTKVKGWSIEDFMLLGNYFLLLIALAILFGYLGYTEYEEYILKKGRIYFRR